MRTTLNRACVWFKFWCAIFDHRFSNRPFSKQHLYAFLLTVTKNFEKEKKSNRKKIVHRKFFHRFLTLCVSVCLFDQCWMKLSSHSTFNCRLQWAREPFEWIVSIIITATKERKKSLFCDDWINSIFNWEIWTNNNINTTGWLTKKKTKWNAWFREKKLRIHCQWIYHT